MKGYRTAQTPPSSGPTILRQFASWHPLLRYYFAAFTILVLGSFLGYTTQFYAQLWLSGLAVIVGVAAFYVARPTVADTITTSRWDFLRATLRLGEVEAGLGVEANEFEETEGKLVMDPSFARQDFGFRYAFRHSDIRDYPIIYLEGHFDSDAMKRLCLPLFEVTKHSGDFMIFDLDEVHSMNERGMDALLYCHRRAPEFGVSVWFVAERRHIANALEKVRRTGVPIYESVSAALTAISENKL